MQCREHVVMLYISLGRVLSQELTDLLKYVKYVTGSLSMKNLWANYIVDSIPTALCFFLHSDLMCYICTAWSMFTRLENT